MGKRLQSIRILEILLDLPTLTPHPRTVKDLELLARARNKRCTCDTCTPKKRFKCLRWPHFTIPLSTNLSTNCYGNTVFAPPKLSSRIAWPPEGMHLARTIITYFDQPRSHLNNIQLSAIASFCAWRDRRWRDILRRTPHPDGRTLLPREEMLHIWNTINEIFFGGRIPGADFRWKKGKNSMLGRTAPGLTGPVITMHPFRTSHDFGDYALLDFLSTLAHESIHAFLQKYPCWWCWSWDKDYNAGGHGRVFQIIAKKMEEVSPKLLGVPLRLGRFESFLGDMGVRVGKEGRRLKQVPSVHDLEVWGFKEVKDVRNRDVRTLVEKTYEQRVRF